MPAIPTPKAKNKENIKQYKRKGSRHNILTNFNGEVRTIMKKVNVIKTVFSSADNNMVGLPISQIKV